MAKKFIHSVIVQNQAIGADGVYDFDLPVNPLSVINLILRPLNDTGTLAQFVPYLGIAAAINRATVLFRGAAFVAARGEDLAALAYFRHGCVPTQAYHDSVNNDARAVVVPIFMGRHAYDDDNCFPASPRGSLSLQLDLDIADTGYDGLRLSVETIELPNAKPKMVERKTTISQTLVVGPNDIDLPLGNDVRGLLAWGTTGVTGASPAPTLGRMITLVDNEAWGYSSTDFEAAHMLHTLYGRQPPMMDEHKHATTVDGNAGTSVTTLGTPRDIGRGWGNYCYLDFDPTRDDQFTLDLKNAQSFRLRPDAETADACRVICVENMPVARVLD